jgi:hypothetical protein
MRKSSQQSLNILPLNSIRNVRGTFASRGRKLCGPTAQRQRFAVDFRNKGFHALRIVAGANTVAPSTALSPDLRSPARGSISLIGYDKVAVTPVSSSAQPTDSGSSGTQKRT